MTKEEAIKILQNIYFEVPEIKEALQIAIEALSKPELPSNPDKAAVQAHIRMEESGEEMSFLNTFKAGAEWMAGQGLVKELVVEAPVLGGPMICCLTEGFKVGDKVVVQIRKK